MGLPSVADGTCGESPWEELRVVVDRQDGSVRYSSVVGFETYQKGLRT